LLAIIAVGENAAVSPLLKRQAGGNVAGRDVGAHAPVPTDPPFELTVYEHAAG
jgi:hypothetical protein